MRWFIYSALVLASYLVSSVGYTSTCATELTACIQAEKYYKQTLQDEDQQIENYKHQSETQQKLINDQDKRLKSPLNDPIKVTVGTGVAVGGAMILGVAAAPAVAVGVGVITAVEVLFGN